MRPICLPLLGEEDADLDGFKMVATGWGKTHDGIYLNLHDTNFDIRYI